jgi:hypothetical protein
MARGTVLLMIGSPYWRRWLIVLMHISDPISSPNAIRATPMVAAT